MKIGWGSKSPLFYIYLIGGIILFVLCIIYVIIPNFMIDLFPGKFRSDIYKGRIKIEYWEKWSGIEAEAMQKVVDSFNQSQDRIWVVKQTISDVGPRFLVSVAGNTAPDIAAIWTSEIPPFSEKGALLPLDNLAEAFHITRDMYIPVFWDIGTYKGHLYALPTAPSTLALHYNKRLFRKAGLDPERPPKTIQELDAIAEKLTEYDENGKIKVIGFTPSYPGWWSSTWPAWFGGKLWDGKETLTIISPENIKAFEWVQSYGKKFDVERLQTFQSGLSGNFASPNNPFLTEQVAMEMQGVWMHNYISKYNPNLEWGAAPFPSAVSGLENVTLADADILVIPSNCRHPREAFEFISFVQQQKNMELLCMGQKKFSPLKNVSKEFWENHPHPYIKLFYELAQSPNVFTYPKIPVWSEMNDEMNAAYTEIWLNKKSPEDALDIAQERINKAWQKEIIKIKKREMKRKMGKVEID